MHVIVSDHLTDDILYRSHSLDAENITRRDQSESQLPLILNMIFTMLSVNIIL